MEDLQSQFVACANINKDQQAKRSGVPRNVAALALAKAGEIRNIIKQIKKRLTEQLEPLPLYQQINYYHSLVKRPTRKTLEQSLDTSTSSHDFAGAIEETRVSALRSRLQARLDGVDRDDEGPHGDACQSSSAENSSHTGFAFCWLESFFSSFVRHKVPVARLTWTARRAQSETHAAEPGASLAKVATVPL
jgi:hypothetical protein